ncbi:hypothetical protein QYE76_014822 [Lolium multiflorum]|uniref:Gag-pol polyprotein n=1 Tax=Lolium multiflorum TaxID=4521 RepID=A0AAD8U1E0_LOLMU|nr:hypothetical protein QYE76_014822 [Lolium multiflorum]
MVYQRNKKAKGDPPLQQQSKRGLQQKSGPTGRATGRPACSSVHRSEHPAHDRSTVANGLHTRTQNPVADRSGLRPASPAHVPVDRSPTGRQPEEPGRRKEARSPPGPTGLHGVRSLVRLTGFVEEKLSCSVELWEIILHGYREPQDPIRLTSTEFYNRQLNASARDKIRSGINRKLLDQVNDIGSAKELWDRIVVLQEGTDLIQSSLYETAKQEAHRFMIREGESVADAYARLGALRVRIKGLGAEKYDDGFEMNEGFIKSKVIDMIAVKQEDTNLALNLQIMTKSADLNSDDLVSYVAANENMAKAGKMLMAMNRVDEASHNHEASHNLALKARADHGGEEEYEIEEDEEMTSTSDIATDFAFFAKKYKGKLPMLLNDKKKKRTCYNCDEESHFANECPYEKRVDKPKFIKGVKPRLKPNPINDRYKRNKGRAFVGAEYLSDEEEEDEEKEAGVAGLAFSKPGSLFTYDYSKDYSTENNVGSSFMARITQDDDSDDSSSSTTVGSYKVKDLETIERAQSLTQELNASKEELEVAHASLTRDLDHLERANKLVKDELKKLGENHDLLQEIYSKALESMNDPIIDKDVASSSTTFTSEHAKLVAEHVRLQEELSLHIETNTYLESLVTKYGLNYYPNESACEQATTLEENVRLKKELAKFTTTKSKMGLDDLLSKQRSNNQKYGLGYVPKPYKKNNYKKEKPAQEKNKKVTNDGKAPKGKATSGDRTGPNNHYALFFDYYGDVYANYVGPRNGYAYRGYSIWGYSSGGPKWVFDSGCTNHMTGGRGVLDQFIEDINKKSSITFGDNSKGKDETHREFITFAKKAQRTYESEIKAIRTDNGTEFKNYTMQEFVDDEGIKHEFSAPYTPQQNGVVERKNRTIIEMARTMLSEFNSPHNFWGEAISTAVHYSNRLFLRPLHNKTPYELLTGNKPNVMYIRVFGCKCLVKNNKGKLGKFETRTIEGIFVGYAENSHAYRYYNRSTGTIEVSCDVVFLEDNGSQVEQVVPCVAGNDDDPSSAIKHMGIGHIRPMEVHSDDQGDGIEVSSSPQVEPSSTQVEPSSATQDVSSTQDEPHPEEQEESPQPTEQDHDDDQETSSTHVQAQVVPHDQVLARDEFIDHEGTIRKIKAATRASDMKVDLVLGSISKGVVTRRHHALLMTYCQHHAFVSSFEPLKVHEALVDPDWVIAMQEELECFTRNEVWSLVERPKDHRINVIGTKWVFKNKQDEDGIVIRNKASSAGGRTKSVSGKRKDKHAAQEDDEIVPTFNVGNVNRLEWQELRTVNPYRFEQRTYTQGDKFFWTKTQAVLWDGYYDSHEFMKNGDIVSPKAINPVELALHEATKYRFVVETLKGMGLYDLVCLKPDDQQEDPTFCPLLVRQFHCTVFFHDDEDRTITWMTGKKKYSCTYSQFRAAMGCGGDSAPGYKIHSRSKLTKGDISFCYPANPIPGPPTISGMYYSYLVLDKMFRENLISKATPVKVRKIDGCDLIHCELKRAVMDRMTPNYAQYVQRLINYIVPAPLNTLGEKVIMDPFKIPTQEATRPDVPSMMPITERRSKERHDPAASSSYSGAPSMETRRRQNEFMATRNVPVPPPGPELAPVVAPWEMPPLTDEMIQNFDFSMYAHGGLPPRTARTPTPPADDGDGDGDEDEGDSAASDDDEGSYSTEHEFY